MTEYYVLTTRLLENRRSEESHNIFLRFRSEFLQRADSGQYPRVIKAETFYDPSDTTAEVEVRLRVTPPLSEAVSQASRLLRDAASAAEILVIDGDENDITDKAVYADEGSHLVASP